VRLKAVAASIAASLASIVLAAPPSARAASPSGSVRLVSQSSWVGRGGDFQLRLLATTKDTNDLEVAVTLYPKVGSRSEFADTVAGHLKGSVVSVASTPLSDLPVDPDGAITVHLPIQDPTQRADRSRIALRGAGVYPVRVELRGIGGGASIDQFTTHLISLPDPVSGPKLETALIVPVSAPPTWDSSGGRRVPTGLAANVTAIASGLAAHPGIPITLLPQAETLQALATSSRPADRDAFDAFARAQTGRPVLASPYVRVLDAAYTNGLESEAAEQRSHGADVLTALLARTVDTETAVADALDDASVTRLRDAQVNRLIARDRALAPVQLRLTLTQPFALRGRLGRRMTTMTADDGLAADFTRSVPPVLGAHQLLADLAVLYFDSPGRTRGVVALPAAGWRADGAFVNTLLDGLADDPVVEPVDIGHLFESVPAATGSSRGSVLTRDAAPTSATAQLPGNDLRRTRHQLAVLDGLTDNGNAVLTGLDERLLAAQSADLRARQRNDATLSVDKAIEHELASIRVPSNVAITLTARRGEIPVTVLRDIDYPVHVVVQLSSDKLTFPEGSTASLFLTRRNTTTRFTVQARTSGTFPLQVTVRSPDGRTALSRGRFTIRSRAASYVGVIVSVGAIVFLVIWWGGHIRQTRRAHRHGTAAADTA
jgi:uncharacterized protein DUF6049